MSAVEGAVKELELDLLVEAIWRRYQYDFRNYSRGSLARRLERALLHFGEESLSRLQHRVLRDPACLNTLLGFLTLQVSEMFRDPHYFALLREKVVPYLRTWPSLKVWVAGCGNGEEFYSLAILFREEGLEERTLFYCTDINRAALEKAEAGIFDLSRIAGFSNNYRAAGGKASLSDYYTAAFGAARFSPSLRKRVVFADHNLASDEVFSEMQLVSSRNVLIYFDRPLQDRALGLFARSLPPGGFLGLGAKESLHFSAHADLFSEFSPRDKVYRRNATAYENPLNAR